MTKVSSIIVDKPSHRFVGELAELATSHGFEIVSCDYVQAKTTNVKKELDVDRTFVQAKFRLKGQA